MAVTTSERNLLGCGRDIDAVWEGIDRPPDAHEQTCPYCQAARADLAALADATRTLSTHDEADPELETPPGVVEHILAVARAEVRRGRRLPLEVGPDGSGPTATISEQAVGTLIRRVADESSAIQVRRCAVRVADAGRDSAQADVVIALRVSTRSDVAIPDAVAELRSALITTVAAEVGIRVESVDVVVEDLHDV